MKIWAQPPNISCSTVLPYRLTLVTELWRLKRRQVPHDAVSNWQTGLLLSAELELVRDILSQPTLLIVVLRVL